MSLPPTGPTNPESSPSWPPPASPPPGASLPAARPDLPPPGWRPPGPFAPPRVGAPPPLRRRRGIAGIAVIAGGAVAGLILLGVALVRANAALGDFARAPAGCTTVLEFDRAGDYSVIVETSGEMPSVAGDCPWSGEFDFEGSVGDLPLRMVDPSAADVAITPSGETLRYDLPWRTGQSVGTVAIERPGEYRLTVGWTGSPAVVAVGRWPVGELVAWALAGVVVGVVALATGVWLLVAGRRGPQSG